MNHSFDNFVTGLQRFYVNHRHAIIRYHCIDKGDMADVLRNTIHYGAYSRQTECASNLRQIGMAVINASTAGKRLQPGKLIKAKDQEDPINLGMPRLLEEHMDKSYAIFKCPSVSGDELGYETTEIGRASCRERV